MAMAPPPPRPPPPRRESLNEYFDNFFDENPDGTVTVREFSEQQIADIEVIEATLEESKHFRLGAASTHQRLDRHLQEYRKTTIVRFAKMQRLAELLTKDVQSPDNDNLFFPNGNDKRAELFANINFYLCYSAQRIRPRSMYDERPRLTTITNRRWSLLYWLRVYLDDPPGFRTLQARTNAAMYTAVNQFGVNTTKKKKPYFGRDELRHLIDFDMARTKAFDVAQSHHLAWTLGCVTGLRPGAIGRTQFRPNAFLRWEHINIQRDPDQSFKFSLSLTLPFMKGFQDIERLESGTVGELVLTLRCPQNADNVSIAPVYRLLAIALRRGLLANYTSVDDLLLGDEVNIVIKSDHLEDPVFLAATERGLALDKDKSASAASFTAYLNKRAKDAGYRGGTMYAFRRKAGTTVDRAAGRPAARAFLNHNPQSLVFEKSYEQTNFDLDIAAIAYGEDLDTGRQKMSEMSSERLYCAELTMTPAQQRLYVDEYVAQYRNPNAPDPKLEARRLRRIAMNGLRAEAQALHYQKFTMTELQDRVRAMKGPSKFVQTIRDRIKTRQMDQDAPSQGLMSEGTTDEQERREGLSDEDLDLDDIEDEEIDLGDRLDILFGDEDVLEQGLGTAESDVDSQEQASPQSDSLFVPAVVQLSSAPPPHRVGIAGAYNFNCSTAAAWAEKEQFDQFTRESQDPWIKALEKLSTLTPPSQSTWAEDLPHLLTKLRGMLNEYGSRTRANNHDRLDPSARLDITLETDQPADVDKVMEAPYELSVKTFLDILLEDSTPTGAARECPECIADSTVAGPRKFKKYRSHSDLVRHQESNMHSPLKVWYRSAEIAQNQDVEGLARCGYGNCDRIYENLNKLQDHLEKLVKAKIDRDDPHFHGMERDGWFLPTFKKSRRSVVGHGQIQASRKKERVSLGRERDQVLHIEQGRLARWPRSEMNKPLTYVTVGGSGLDLAAIRLRYPATMPPGPNNSSQLLRQGLERDGLLGHFASFGHEEVVTASASNTLKEKLDAAECDDLVAWGDGKVRKF